MVKPRGHVSFDGKDVAGKKPEAIARLGIAQVPEGRGTFTGLTVRENLRVGALSRRDGDVKADIDRCFERFPVLGEREGQAAGSLSGGEQQMLAVARALMLRPKLLLLDEPSLGLAPKITSQLFSDLATVARDEGTTVLLVEQNANLALKFADYAYVLGGGPGRAVGQGVRAGRERRDATQLPGGLSRWPSSSRRSWTASPPARCTGRWRWRWC